MWNLFLYLAFIPAARGICKCFQLTNCGVLANPWMYSAKHLNLNQLPFPAVPAAQAMLTTPFAKFCPVTDSRSGLRDLQTPSGPC